MPHTLMIRRIFTSVSRHKRQGRMREDCEKGRRTGGYKIVHIAKKGKKYNSQYEKMTQEPVGSLVVKLGIPTTVSMLVTSIYNMVDTIFVGKLGTSASGAVGVVFGFMAILQAFGFMYGQGAGSIISRQLGRKDSENASKIASTSFFLALGTGALIGIIGFAFMNPLMYLFGSTDTILPYARQYVACIMIAAPFMTSSFVLNNILRFEGKAAFAMIGLLAGAILNMVMDPFFMFVLNMGIIGAGLSTAISQVISFGLLLFMFFSGKTESKISVKKFTKNFLDIADIVATGFPSLVRQGLTSISTMLLNRESRVYGDAAVAAMGIVSRISMFIFSVGLGIGQGFQPVCGFNYGAGKYSRVKSAFRFTLIAGEVMMGVMAVVILIFSSDAIGVFRNDPDVIRFGTPALRYQCIALFTHPLTVLSNMTLQSTGKRMRATILSMLRSGVYFVPILLIMTRCFGIFGIQTAQPLADVLSFLTVIPFMIVFFKEMPNDDKAEANVHEQAVT